MKLSRRSFVGSMAAAAATFGRWSNKAFASSTADLCQYVDPKIGTGGFGHCFPAATVPLGAVQHGPDTGDHDWAHCSGYHYNDDKILEFSHTHLSGTGVGDMQDFRVMPGYSKHHSGQTTAQAFIAHFSHAHEHAEPGYCRITLDDSKIETELTATERAGFHRYTFPEEKGAFS